MTQFQGYAGGKPKIGQMAAILVVYGKIFININFSLSEIVTEFRAVGRIQ